MNKLMTLALCGTILLSLTACGAKTADTGNLKDTGNSIEYINTITNENAVEIPSSMMEYATLQEAEAELGFEVKVPTKLLENYTEETIYTIGDTMAGIIYSNASSQMTYRQAKGDEDISGDHNEYSEISTRTINGLDVTFKGNNDKVNVAIWTDGEDTFAISIDNLGEGIENDKMTTMISSIQ